MGFVALILVTLVVFIELIGLFVLLKITSKGNMEPMTRRAVVVGYISGMISTITIAIIAGIQIGIAN